MPIKYLYKCNPKVAEAVGLTTFDRYHWPDGTMLLWTNDLIAIDRVRFYKDNENFLADLGAVRMTDPEAFAEQQNPTIRLPEARLPEYRWEQPDYSGVNLAESGETEDADVSGGGKETAVPSDAGTEVCEDEEGGGEG